MPDEASARAELNTRNPIHRAFELLGALSRTPAGTAGVRELASGLKLPPSSVHRTLRTLELEGLVATTADGQYYLGAVSLALARQIESKNPLVRGAEIELEHLVSTYNETMMLGIYEPVRRQMMFLTAVESSQPIRYVPQFERVWVTVHAGASGLGILAFLPSTEIEKIIAGGLPPITDNTITDPDQLREEIRMTRQRGYAISVSQRFEGAAGIAVPILRADGWPIGDLVITMPAARLDDVSDKLSAMVEALRAAAARLGAESSRPGGTGTPLP